MSVYLWVDPLSEDETSLQSILCHTSIYVEFGEDLKYVFSYNDDGLSCFPAVSEFVIFHCIKFYKIFRVGWRITTEGTDISW